MKKIVIGAALLALAGQAGAITLELDAVNQRSSSGSLSTLRWEGCTNYAAHTSCINPASAMAAKGITPSTAVWDWDAGTGVLSMTGAFNSASSLSSAAMGPMVIGDKVTNMTIDTVNNTTSASTYECVEGNFLAGVGANGCLNISIGGNFALESSAVYNVGGNANCVNRTIGGDDTSTGNVRTLFSTGAGGGCDAGDGAFNMWTVVQDNLGSGGTLIISNGIDIGAAGTSYLTFSAVPVPGAVWLFGSAVGLLGLVRRRIAA
ncbi:MAG: hypothetical protein B6D47_02735 [Rhodocyclaceae bacterium UTPRO2]|jgi:hypothetical protein|nr:MAG: hypothetical protein B6D47_02735 [Rhodocyclaceae bacterium UTPRO2]